MHPLDTSIGLRPIQHDRSKDWSHKKRFGAGVSLMLPKTLGRLKLPVDNQRYTNFCTGYAKSKAISYITGIDCSPEWQAAKEGEYVGQPIVDGTDPKTAMQTAVLNGALPKQFATLSLEKDGEQKVGDWRNWDSTLDTLALPQAPKGWYAVADDPASDIFDDIRIALYKAYQDNKAPVMASGEWFQDWSNAGNNGQALMPIPVTARSAYHDYLFVDFDTIDGKEVLIAHLSSGPEFGINGFLYFDRITINTIWDRTRQIRQGTGLYVFRSTGSNIPSLIDIGNDLLRRLSYLISLLGTLKK
jgi:hypothetical protein